MAKRQPCGKQSACLWLSSALSETVKILSYFFIDSTDCVSDLIVRAMAHVASTGISLQCNNHAQSNQQK